jgi:hypothetical protein
MDMLTPETAVSICSWGIHGSDTDSRKFAAVSWQFAVRDEAEIKVPGCEEFLFVVFVATPGA